MFNNSGANAELQISSRKKIKLIGHPRRLLVKVWADVSTLHPELQTALHSVARSVRKQKEPSRALCIKKQKYPLLCVSISGALQSRPNFQSWLLLTGTITHWTRQLSLCPLCNFTISQAQIRSQHQPVGRNNDFTAASPTATEVKDILGLCNTWNQMRYLVSLLCRFFFCYSASFPCSIKHLCWLNIHSLV